VAIDPNRLKAMGTSITEIFTALEKTIRIQEVLILIKSPTLISSVESDW
jgi:hypothetical protein